MENHEIQGVPRKENEKWVETKQTARWDAASGFSRNRVIVIEKLERVEDWFLKNAHQF